MKHIYFNLFLIFSFICAFNSNAQTYTIDASGTNVCNSNTGIDGPYLCINDTSPTTDLGSFTDTNSSGMELTALSVDVYDACNGEFEVFLNGVSIGNGTTTGTGCNCQSIASNPNITNSIDITLTQDIIDAYVIGGSNTISINANNSGTSFGGQCFYGAEVTVTAEALSTRESARFETKIYPNPASDRITISNLKESSSYSITDTNGKIVMRGKIEDNGAIVVKNLTNGVYFLNLENKKVIKFIKQ